MIMGNGRFVAPKTIAVRLNDGGTRTLTREKVFLNQNACGYSRRPGSQGAPALTHIEACELDYLPSHLIGLGGDYVGLEMAQARLSASERQLRVAAALLPGFSTQRAQSQHRRREVWGRPLISFADPAGNRLEASLASRA
jgi:pyruvate/2-oxoglutarate dehydrogenase complex dihydrolipoamide dehydrogenase (E3) component